MNFLNVQPGLNPKITVVRNCFIPEPGHNINIDSTDDGDAHIMVLKDEIVIQDLLITHAKYAGILATVLLWPPYHRSIFVRGWRKL